MKTTRAFIAAVVLALASPVGAQNLDQDGATPETVTQITAAQGERGPVTNLPMPRFVSLKANEANVRRGPSLSHRIDWVFARRDMPLHVVGEYGHWRRVVDREGLGGWVHYSMISGNRTVIIDRDLLVIRNQPQANATEVAMLELGVIADLGECDPEWCRLRAGGYRGWALKTSLFGVAPDEVRE